MKKLIIIFVILFNAFIISAQVAVMKAIEASITFTENWNDAESTTLNTPFFIVANHEQGIIKINEKHFFIKESSTEKSVDENKSKEYTQHHNLMLCINQEGEDVVIITSYYISNQIKYGGKYDMRVRVCTDNEWVSLYCKLLSSEQ